MITNGVPGPAAHMWADDLATSLNYLRFGVGLPLANAERTEGLSDLAYRGGEAVLS